LALEPTAILVGVHVREEIPGVGQSDTVVFCEDWPNVAVTTAWSFAEIAPAVAVTFPLTLPAGMLKLGGMDSSAELEFSNTVKSTEAG
jgi:hypothetical protein